MTALNFYKKEITTDSLENFKFYVDEVEFGHVIANFDLFGKSYSIFLQLPKTPDSIFSLHEGYDLSGKTIFAQDNGNDESGEDWMYELADLCIEKIKDEFKFSIDYLLYVATGGLKREEVDIGDDFYVVQCLDNKYYLVELEEIGGYDMTHCQIKTNIGAGNFAQAVTKGKKIKSSY